MRKFRKLEKRRNRSVAEASKKYWDDYWSGYDRDMVRTIKEAISDLEMVSKEYHRNWDDNLIDFEEVISRLEDVQSTVNFLMEAFDKGWYRQRIVRNKNPGYPQAR